MSETPPSIEGGPSGDQPGDGTNVQGPHSGETRDAAAQVLGGRFEVHEEIGSGAFAVTYRGRDRRLGRSVAIKVLRQTFSSYPGFVQSIEREARAAALVNHGNVVDVYDFGQHDDLLYMVMQYIEGEDLKHLIAREGPLPDRRAVEIALQMLAGLAAIHQAGIIHRDIKPQNVMIGRDGTARVTDFGIARVTVDMGLTTAGTAVGTASYMAPEQAQAGTLTEATDLYSVGVVLYEMLTGRLPFEAPTTIALMLAHIQTRPVPPSARAPGQRISPELDAVVMRALAKRPEDRFADAPDMARVLTAAVGHAPAVADSTRTMRVVDADTVRTVSPASTLSGKAYPAAADPQPARIVPAGASPRSRARRAMWALPLLLVLLLAGGLGGAALFDNVSDGDRDDRPRELVANLSLTPTADEEVVETPAPTTEQPAPTDTPEPSPTETPVPSPTRTPEPTPPDTPPPTRAEPTETPEPSPTDTPVPLPTRTPEPVPTDPPVEIEAADDAGEALITRRDEVDEPDGSGEGEAADQADIDGATEETPAGEPVESGTMTMGFTASDWRGAYFQETGNMRPWSALYAQSTGFGTATLSFTIDGEPASETFTLTVDGMTSENWTELPIAIRVNGQEVYSGDSPFPTWSGVDGEQPWSTVSIELPTSVLQQGENAVTFVNLRAEGEFSRPPYILLADGSVTMEIAQPRAVRTSYGDTSPARRLHPGNVDGGRELVSGARMMRRYGWS